MNGAPSDIFIDFLRARTDIVGLIQEVITLHADVDAGTYRGMCPFHRDEKLSFVVNSKKQSYRCWICNEGGDCFSFLMKYDTLSFEGALEVLARRAISCD